MTKVNLAQRFDDIDELWSPRMVASVNNFDVKLVRIDGEFIWHQHDETDELFLVVNGELRIEFESCEPVVLGPGELCVVPKGVQHRPVSDGATRMLLLEPAGTLSTGDSGVPGTAGDRIA